MENTVTELAILREVAFLPAEAAEEVLAELGVAQGTVPAEKVREVALKLGDKYGWPSFQVDQALARLGVLEGRTSGSENQE